MIDSTGSAATSRVPSELHLTAVATPCATFESTRFDFDTVFILQKGNLAVLHEAQALLVDAVHAITRVQLAYLEQLLFGAPQVASAQEFSDTAPSAVIFAKAAAAIEQGMTMVREVVGLGVDAHQRIGALLSRGVRLNLDT